MEIYINKRMCILYIYYLSLWFIQWITFFKIVYKNNIGWKRILFQCDGWYKWSTSGCYCLGIPQNEWLTYPVSAADYAKYILCLRGFGTRGSQLPWILILYLYIYSWNLFCIIFSRTVPVTTKCSLHLHVCFTVE